MPTSQEHIRPDTPMGATLVGDGATFRVWAPRAIAVHACGAFNDWRRDEASRLVKNPDGRWTGFISGAREGTEYKFYVVGQGSEGFKRDPYARELTKDPAYPRCNCIIRNPSTYEWQDGGWRPPAFNHLIVYQLHLGTFYGPSRETRVATLLDAINRLEYLADLGVNAVEPLPIVEYNTPRSMGYNGSDLFSPEMDYQVDPDRLGSYLPQINGLFARKGKRPVSKSTLAIPINQLKVFVDLCHAYGIAVLLDIVFNHASGDLRQDEHDESIYFFDRMPRGDDNRSLYFTDREHTGPVFAIWQSEVRQFLIDNTSFFLDEYHVDGLRYDQVSVMVQENQPHGWRFCQAVTTTTRTARPAAIGVAEYWGVDPAIVRSGAEGGAGFDAAWHDGLRTSLRGVLAQAAGGRDTPLDWSHVASQLRAPGFARAWSAVQCIESHDEVYRGRAPRIPALADSSNPRSWYARSRARVALSLLMTAPGIPMIFMGQEFLEDKQWHDDAKAGALIWWEGLERGDRVMVDFHRFTRELLWMRRKHPALRAEGVAVLALDNFARVLAFQRWVPGVGRDVIVVASLNEQTLNGYRVPVPVAGEWLEVLNSDVYDNWVNPSVAGNGGRVIADGHPLNGLPASAALTIPANGVLVLARDSGD